MGNMLGKGIFNREWWEFLDVLVEKELRMRYKMAIFGFAWIFINPIIQMLVMGFIFQFFVPVKTANYFEFLFPGLLVWNFFSYTVLKNTPIFIGERALLKKANFPKETLVLSVVIVNLLNFLLALIVFVTFEWLVLSEVHWWRWWLLPGIMVWLTVLTTGLSLLFSSLNVKWRDVNYGVQALMPLWFYATPIVYSIDLLPKWAANFVYFNPMTAIVEILRWVVIGTPVGWVSIWVSLLSTLIIFVLGWIVFKNNSSYFDDWL
jgi:ABC-2 type transport system permease protein